MRIAFLADIHANLEAFEAALAEARRIGADKIVVLGDVVGYGADPSAVLDRVRDLVEAGAQIVLGNHDAAVFDAESDMNSAARAGIELARRELSAEQVEFLRGLPLTIDEDDRLYVHASAHGPRAWHYVTSSLHAERSLRATAQRLTFCGHVHVPQLYHVGSDGTAKLHKPAMGEAMPLARSRKWLSVVGSVGQPRDGNPSAALALYDTERLQLSHVRIAYDAEKAAKKIMAAGLPHSLASRLLRGQ